VVDTLAYFGGLDFRVLNVADPSRPVEIGRYSTPWRVKRLFYAAPYVYAACFGAGVCILETTTSTGVDEVEASGEKLQPLSVFPNPTTGTVRVCGAAPQATNGRIRLYDAAGRLALEVPLESNAGLRAFSQPVDMSHLPSGTFFVRMEGPITNTKFQKVIKMKGR
jgi:hypothetical protein